MTPQSNGSSSFWPGLPLALLLALTTGCSAIGNLFGGPDVKAVATSVQKPANVALYLEVTEGDEPVTELENQNFQIYENGQLLAADEIGQRLLPREPVTNERVVVLVDLSGKPKPELRESYAKAVENFVARVQSELAVTVLAYDGGPGLKFAGDFPRAPEGSPPPNAAGLRGLAPGDASRDLYGAVLKGVKELDIRLMAQKKPVRIGTLLVFARGPDLAGRLTQEQLEQALENQNYNLIGVGVGEQTPYLDQIAHAGVIHAQGEDTVPIAFEEAASRVLKTHHKYYVIAYCSPARAGTPSLRVEVHYTSKDNDDKTGSYSYQFDAQGFGPGCNPDSTPHFVVPKSENEAAPASTSTEPAANPADATTSPNGAAPGGEVAPPPDKPEYK
ncbi:MAG TPA: hypothetical protein VGP93_19875 [Polyangiaceae bacterium]|nr:hypothetical protein [Polyangiaceae bacterium]